MRVRVKDLAGFKHYVFGAQSFLERWPEILTTGIRVQLRPTASAAYYYVSDDYPNKPLGSFFTADELAYLEVMIESPVEQAEK